MENIEELKRTALEVSLRSREFTQLALETKDAIEEADSLETLKTWFKGTVGELGLNKYFGFQIMRKIILKWIDKNLLFDAWSVSNRIKNIENFTDSLERNVISTKNDFRINSSRVYNLEIAVKRLNFIIDDPCPVKIGSEIAKGTTTLVVVECNILHNEDRDTFKWSVKFLDKTKNIIITDNDFKGQ